MTKLMLQGVRDDTSTQNLIRDALDRAGFTPTIP